MRVLCSRFLFADFDNHFDNESAYINAFFCTFLYLRPDIRKPETL